ncbi:MAG: hypothetical protein K0R57_2070 [Paenibacillaceae bacterium]|nr:hypothetical protein [Paenibacillaceae bacterium]
MQYFRKSGRQKVRIVSLNVDVVGLLSKEGHNYNERYVVTLTKKQIGRLYQLLKGED